MAITNLHTVAIESAKQHGVRVTGMDCKDSMRQERFPAPQSLPGLPSLGLYSVRTGPDAGDVADNAVAALAVTRAGRSVSEGARIGTTLSKAWPGSPCGTILACG
ncbi:MAG: hypothetical protein FJ303_05915 [Planctomycetes bacterium]|nr:hypothetical protein [Planctomycetota bacterium]